MKTAAVIFDMDGLLFDTERLYLEQSKITEREMGCHIPMELQLETIGRTIQDCRKIYFSHFGDDFPVDKFMISNKKLVHAYIEREGLPIKPGAEELIAELHKRGIRMMLASSSPHRMIEKNLLMSGLKDYFHEIISGEDVAAGKPAPDIFLKAAERADQEPGNCIVLEDSNNGVRAAYAAGMRPVMVPDVKQPEADVKEMLYRIYADLHEVRRDLDRIIYMVP